MKVCIISPFPPPYGGMAVQAQKLVEMLSKEGVEVASVKTNADLPKCLGVLIKLPFVRTFVNTICFLINLNTATKNIDVVYFLTGFFNFFFWITVPAIILLRIKRKRIILSARGGGAGTFFKRYGKLIIPAMKMVDVVTTPSGFLKMEFKKAFQLDTIIIPNIADLEQFECRVKNEFRPKLLVTRNLEKIYNIQCLIHAFALVKKRYPDAVLSVVGDGTEKDGLVRLVTELELTDSVTFSGRIPHHQIQELYDRHDIFVNSSDVDNLPGVILEAFACGLPVVSTDAGGIPYIVKDGINGYLVKRNDHKALAKQIIRVLDNPEIAMKLSENAKKECKKYSWESVKKILLPLLFGTK